MLALISTLGRNAKTLQQEPYGNALHYSSSIGYQPASYVLVLLFMFLVRCPNGQTCLDLKCLTTPSLLLLSDTKRLNLCVERTHPIALTGLLTGPRTIDLSILPTLIIRRS